jgi:hypothetical protein
MFIFEKLGDQNNVFGFESAAVCALRFSFDGKSRREEKCELRSQIHPLKMDEEHYFFSPHWVFSENR